jgi:hypothetical protein
MPFRPYLISHSFTAACTPYKGKTIDLWKRKLAYTSVYESLCSRDFTPPPTPHGRFRERYPQIRRFLSLSCGHDSPLSVRTSIFEPISGRLRTTAITVASEVAVFSRRLLAVTLFA